MIMKLFENALKKSSVNDIFFAFFYGMMVHLHCINLLHLQIGIAVHFFITRQGKACDFVKFK